MLRDMARSVPGYNWLLEHSHLVQLVRRAALGSQTGDGPAARDPIGTPAAVALAEALFEHLSDLCEARDLDLLVLSTGFLDADLSMMTSTTEYADSFYAGADEFFDAQGIGYVDIGPRLSDRVGGDLGTLQFPDDPHPNAAGAELIAETSWTEVRDWIAGMIGATGQPHVEKTAVAAGV